MTDLWQPEEGFKRPEIASPKPHYHAVITEAGIVIGKKTAERRVAINVEAFVRLAGEDNFDFAEFTGSTPASFRRGSALTKILIAVSRDEDVWTKIHDGVMVYPDHFGPELAGQPWGGLRTEGDRFPDLIGQVVKWRPSPHPDGGHSVYVNPGGDEPFIGILPADNTASLVRVVNEKRKPLSPAAFRVICTKVGVPCPLDFKPALALPHWSLRDCEAVLQEIAGDETTGDEEMPW